MTLVLPSKSQNGSVDKHYKSFLSVFQLCQLWIQITTFNVTFEMEEAVDILSSVLKYDMGKSNIDDKYECSTCRTDNRGILSTAACGTATSEHSQPLLVMVREHLYLLPVECLECILSDIERLFISNQFKKVKYLNFLITNLKCIFKFNSSQKIECYLEKKKVKLTRAMRTKETIKTFLCCLFASYFQNIGNKGAYVWG